VRARRRVIDGTRGRGPGRLGEAAADWELHARWERALRAAADTAAATAAGVNSLPAEFDGLPLGRQPATLILTSVVKRLAGLAAGFVVVAVVASSAAKEVWTRLYGGAGERSGRGPAARAWAKDP
jgi:hypothetical protein